MKTRVFKKFGFDAAHILEMPTLTPAENKDMFGKCNNLHGHTYILEVGVEGPVLPNGMVCNFDIIRNAVKPIVDRLDHSHLNESLPPPYLPATAENIVAYIWDQAEVKLMAAFFDTPIDQTPRLMLMRLYETPTSYVEVLG